MNFVITLFVDRQPLRVLVKAVPGGFRAKTLDAGLPVERTAPTFNGAIDLVVSAAAYRMADVA